MLHFGDNYFESALALLQNVLKGSYTSRDAVIF